MESEKISPNKQLASLITQKLTNVNAILPEDVEDFESKLGAGIITRDDWRRLIEKSIDDKKQENLNDENKTED